MWFVVGIIWAWVLTKRRSRKKHKRQDIKVMLMVCLTTIVSIDGNAQTCGVKISGEIYTTLQKQGRIIVFLVDESTFKTPFTGIDTLILDDVDKIIHFEFEKREKGEYGIRCFHDVNGNGILDKRLFAPAEPYGLSWRGKRKFPFNFKDISFEVKRDTYITIKMED